MNRIIQRYIAFNFLPPFLVSCLFFVIFLLTFQLFRITRIIINKSVQLSTVLELVSNIAISFLPVAIPLSILFATIYSMSKLSEDSEITAMRSFGNSKLVLITPLLIMGFFISLVVFFLNMNLIPYAQKQFRNQIIKMTSKGVLADVESGKFFTDVPGVTLFAEKVTKKGKVLENVFIHFKDSKKKSEQIIFAKKGVLKKQKKSSWDIGSLRLKLTDGNIVGDITRKHKSKGSLEKILFDSYDFPLINKNYTLGFITKDSMRTSRELYEIIYNNKNINNNMIKTKLEFWSRINTPIQTIIFVILGFCFGIKKGRGQSGNTSGIVMIILILYYALFFTGVSFAKKNLIPAEIVVLLPTFVLMGICYRYYRRLDWLS